MSNALLPVVANSLLPGSSLDGYIAYVNGIPMLTAKEELEYSDKLVNNGDLQAAHKLVLSHLRYVVKVAKGYAGYGLSLADLIQEGNIGLMKAVKKFDPGKGVRLATFAMHWIKSEIHEFVLKNWRIVKVATTKAQRKLFFKLRSMKKSLGWMSKEESQWIAESLGVKEAEVIEMEQRLFSKDSPFELPCHDHNGGNSFAPIDYLEDHDAKPDVALLEQQHQHFASNQLQQALQKLEKRSQDILYSRLLAEDQHKVTLQSLADKYGISKERVRQLESQAVDKLKELLATEIKQAS